MDEHQYRHDPPEEPFDVEDEAPPDALPASPGLRKLVIVLYIVIMICVIAGLVLSLFWSGIVADRWSPPLPDRWSF